MSGSTSGYKTQSIYHKLKNHSDSVVFNRFDAAAAYEMFRGYPIDANRCIRLDYRTFLQAATMAAIEGSKGLRDIKSQMEAAFLIPGQTKLPNIVIKLFSSAVLKAYQWSRNRREAESGAVYQMAVNAVAYGYSSVFDAIDSDLDIDDYL